MHRGIVRAVLAHTVAADSSSSGPRPGRGRLLRFRRPCLTSKLHPHSEGRERRQAVRRGNLRIPRRGPWFCRCSLPSLSSAHLPSRRRRSPTTRPAERRGTHPRYSCSRQGDWSRQRTCARRSGGIASRRPLRRLPPRRERNGDLRASGLSDTRMRGGAVAGSGTGPGRCQRTLGDAPRGSRKALTARP